MPDRAADLAERLLVEHGAAGIAGRHQHGEHDQQRTGALAPGLPQRDGQRGIPARAVADSDQRGRRGRAGHAAELPLRREAPQVLARGLRTQVHDRTAGTGHAGHQGRTRGARDAAERHHRAEPRGAPGHAPAQQHHRHGGRGEEGLHHHRGPHARGVRRCAGGRKRADAVAALHHGVQDRQGEAQPRFHPGTLRRTETRIRGYSDDPRALPRRQPEHLDEPRTHGTRKA